MGTRAIDSLGGLLKIGRSRLGNLHELLRVAINNRKPAALYLHHDTVPPAKGVIDVGRLEVEGRYLPRHEGFGSLKAVAEFAAERFAAYQLLIAAHAHRIGRK